LQNANAAHVTAVEGLNDFCHFLKMAESPVRHQADVAVPRSLGQYKYMRTIGAGFCSVVVLVQHGVTHREFACKLVSRQFLIEQNIFDRFEREVRLMESISHPHLVQLEEVIYLPDWIGVVMEYCPGGDLLSYISGSAIIQEPQAATIFWQLCNAVKHLHSRNISHRDIKPENILLDGHLTVKLCDFGFARVQKPDALMMTPCGSPFYSAPEVVDSRQYDGKAADIWSMGVVLYAMCTCTLPWVGGNMADMVRQMRTAHIIYPEGMSMKLRRILIHMLDPNPENRPTIDEIMNAPWLAHIQQQEEQGRRRASAPSLQSLPPIPQSRQPFCCSRNKRANRRFYFYNGFKRLMTQPVTV
jgi:serine/threonine protein kinase